MMAASSRTSGSLGASNTPGTRGGPTSSGEMPNGGRAYSGTSRSKQPTTGSLLDPQTRDQILRERYLKGLKKRKCTVCGNTARARCPYRACKTCCSRAQNPCTVHVLKADKCASQGAILHPSFNVPPASIPDQPWLPHHMQVPMSSGYLRPGYNVPSPYSLPTPMRMGLCGAVTLDPNVAAAAAAAKKYASPGAQRWASTNVIDQHQELQRKKILRIAAQKEAMMINLWRSQKMKEHAIGKMLAEDEAFDRYRSNASLLEEVFALDAEGLRGLHADRQLLVHDEDKRFDKVEANGDDNSLRNAGRTRLAADPNRKEAKRQRLKQIVARRLRKLTSTEHEPEFPVESEDTLQGGVPAAAVSERRWEPKRFKARTGKGQQVLETMEVFEELMQKLKNIRSPEDIQACVDSYKSSLGGSLSYLLPHLYPREDVNGNTSNDRSDKRCDGTLTSPRAMLLSYLSGVVLEANPGGQFVINHRNKDLAPHLARSSFEVMERPWESGVEKLERLHWHRKFLRGMGWWKVHAHDDAIQSMCFERANANTVVMEL